MLRPHADTYDPRGNPLQHWQARDNAQRQRRRQGFRFLAREQACHHAVLNEDQCPLRDPGREESPPLHCGQIGIRQGALPQGSRDTLEAV